MDVRERLSMTTQLGQAWGGDRGRGSGRFVSRAFPGGRCAGIGRGHAIIDLDLFRVFSQLVDAVRRRVFRPHHKLMVALGVGDGRPFRRPV